MNDLSVYRVKTKITERINEDSKFRDNLNNLYLFYGRKILATCRNESDKKTVTDHIEDLVNNQFLHGYHLVYSLQEKEAHAFENLLELAPGVLKTNLRTLIERLFVNDDVGNSICWWKNDLTDNYLRLFLNEIIDSFEIVSETMYELALEGAYSALAEQSQYLAENSKGDEIHSIFGNALDAHFFNPEIYALVSYFDETNAIVDLYKIGNANEQDLWVGSVEYFKLQGNGTSNIIISVSTLVREEEYLLLCEAIIQTMPKRLTIDSKIRTQRVLEVKYVNYSPETSED